MRKLSNIFYLLSLTIICPLSVMGQFERKVSVYASVGVSGFSKNQTNIGNNNEPNVLIGYKASPTVGVAAFYALDGHLSVGGSLRFLWATKSQYRVFANTIGAEIKYNIIPADKKISPYVFFEGNLSFNSVKQANYVETRTYPNSTNAGSNDTAQVTTQHITYQAVNLKFVPAFGMFFGGGVDIKVKETLNFFVQAGYNTTYLKGNNLVKDNFNPNSNLSYLNVSVGVRLNLFQKKSFY